MKMYMLIVLCFGCVQQVDARRVSNMADAGANFKITFKDGSTKNMEVGSFSGTDLDKAIEKMEVDVHLLRQEGIISSYKNMRVTSSDRGDGNWKLSGSNGMYTLAKE